MGWLFEWIIEGIWEEWAYRIYKKHGWFWALAAVIGPMVLIIGVTALVVALIR